MSNIGRHFASEMERYIDKKRGREVVQLTKRGTNWHLYFTDNSFTTGDEEIIYLHSDYTLREKANTEVFRMNLNLSLIHILYQSPVNVEEDTPYYHFHINFFPPMRSAEKQKFNASSETGAWAHCNPTATEEKAEELRAAYKKFIQKGE